MKKIKNILVPTDFSKNAQNALEYAQQFAAPFDATIDLLHAYRPDIRTYTNTAIRLERIRKNAEKALYNSIGQPTPAEVGVLEQVTIRPRLEAGFAIDVIKEVCEKDEVDLVIMGTKGATNLTDTLFGSVTTDIIRHTDQPVLVIPEKAKFEGIYNIAFATDLSMAEPYLLTQVSRIANKFRATLHCVHINIKPRQKYKIIEHIEDEVKQLNTSPLRVEFTEVNSSSIIEGLEAFIADNQIDMLVMYAHHNTIWDRLFHASLTRKMALHTTTPLLVLKEADYPFV